MNVVEIEGVSQYYGDVAVLRGLDLNLAQGEVLGLFGHNGAGKTTTMKLILGLLRASEGQVRVFGRAPSDPSVRQMLGYLPENVMFYPQLSGLETLRHFARLKGATPEQVQRLLEEVGLAGAATRRVKTYSKGMRQRLGLAQALLGQPRLLLLDEPTVGLDPIATQDLYQLLDRLRWQGHQHHSLFSRPAWRGSSHQPRRDSHQRAPVGLGQPGPAAGGRRAADADPRLGPVAGRLASPALAQRGARHPRLGRRRGASVRAGWQQT
nr:hypothetical protein GCM10020185_79600 [Pseudomonas brassicacearum subsp. brassicacearum]